MPMQQIKTVWTATSAGDFRGSWIISFEQQQIDGERKLIVNIRSTGQLPYKYRSVVCPASLRMDILQRIDGQTAVTG